MNNTCYIAWVALVLAIGAFMLALIANVAVTDNAKDIAEILRNVEHVHEEYVAFDKSVTWTIHDMIGHIAVMEVREERRDDLRQQYFDVNSGVQHASCNDLRIAPAF